MIYIWTNLLNVEPYLGFCDLLRYLSRYFYEMAGGVIQQLLRRKLQSHSPVNINSSLFDNFVLL